MPGGKAFEGTDGYLPLGGLAGLPLFETCGPSGTMAAFGARTARNTSAIE